MTIVYLGVGSNCERERNLTLAMQLLQQQFSVLACSAVYESESLSGPGQPYFNLCVQIETRLSLVELKSSLIAIEQACGRLRDGTGRCALDVDILLCEDRIDAVDSVRLPHPDVLRRAFVLQPLSELAPDLIHPDKQKTLLQLWRTFPDTCSLRKVPFSLHSAV